MESLSNPLRTDFYDRLTNHLWKHLRDNNVSESTDLSIRYDLWCSLKDRMGYSLRYQLNDDLRGE